MSMSGALPSTTEVGNAQDNWTSESYQRAAGFVPQMTEKVLALLDAQPTDTILDIGCGDGILTKKIAERLKDGTGIIWGIDSSPSMIETANRYVPDGPISSRRIGYSVMDATDLLDHMNSMDLTPLQREEIGIADANELIPGRYSKVFSNAALHWILRKPESREKVFRAIFCLLQPGGHLVFEMGGHGNVAELRAALISATAHRVGINAARAADPWFFPDQKWMETMLSRCGFKNIEMESEYRPTKATTGEGGGIKGWVELMGKEFLSCVPEEHREEVVREVCETLETVCGTESGVQWMGYVRLRVKAVKPSI